jgi:hypothetical protein
MEQMTIFDYISELDGIPEDEMARQIGEAVGMVFKPVKYDSAKYIPPCQEYEARVSKYERYELQYSTYFDTNKKYISAGWMYRTCGGGCPCDSIEEAIEYINKAKVKAKQEKKRLERVRERNAGF